MATVGGRAVFLVCYSVVCISVAVANAERATKSKVCESHQPISFAELGQIVSMGVKGT